MRKLVPLFIIEQTRLNCLSGQTKAVVVNVDLIGFTAITQGFVQDSPTGVEFLIDNINAIFTPAISTLESRGGYISGFAGDAFTAIFDHEQLPQAISAAIEIRDVVKSHAWNNQDYKGIDLQVRIGIGCGDVSWQIIPNPIQSVYWFCGQGIAQSVEAQLLAQPNEVVTFQDIVSGQDPLFCDFEQIDVVHCRIKSTKRSTEVHSVSSIDVCQDAFVPESLSQLLVDGEFREVLSCFVNLRSDGNEQRRIVIESALEHGGYISHIDCTDKGWVMYVMFGAPKRYDQTQLRALNYAYEQQARFGNCIRIGLSEGRAYAGFVGSTLRGEYTGMGFAVNLAARIMMTADWGEVWLDNSIQKAIESAFCTENLGNLDYKGYPLPVQTFKLTGKQTSTDHSCFTNTFIGRKIELEFLVSSCKDIYDGKFAGVSYLYGAHGQGKTRLLYELKQKLGNSVQLITLQADSIHNIALDPFASWIRTNFTKDISGTQLQRTAEFRKNWALYVNQFENRLDYEIIRTELSRIESVIAALIGLDWEDSLYSHLDPKSRSSVSGLSIKSLLETMCKLKPVILVLEDLHWLDPASADVMALLARNAERVPLKIIITSRFRDDGSMPVISFYDQPRQDSLVLEGLSSREIGTIVQGVFDQSVSESLLAYIERSSLGNPFIIVQLSMYLLETGKLEPSESGYVLKELSTELPASIQDVLVARIDRLETQLKRMVHNASVIGCEFSEAILKAMLTDPNSKPCPLGEDLIHVKLQQGEMEQIWNNISELSYIFSHSLLRDAAYGMQLIKQLKHLHLLAAEAMNSQYAEDRARYAQIAFHYEKAGETFRAAQYHQKAGDYDKNMFHFFNAKEHYIAARDLVETVRGTKHPDYALCIGRIGMVYWENSEYNEALAHFGQALSIIEGVLGKDQPECVDYIQNMGSCYLIMGEFNKALDYLSRALEIQSQVSGTSNPELANTIHIIGNVYRAQKDYQQALVFYEQALSIRKEVFGDKHAKIASLYNDIGDLYWRKGDYSQAILYYELALSIKQDVFGTKHPEIATSLHGLGDVYYKTGHYDKALSYYKQALSIRLEVLGIRHASTAEILHNLGIIYDLYGEYEKSLNYYEQAMQVKREIFGEMHFEVATVMTNMGSVYDHQGYYDRALELHEKALNIWKRVSGDRCSETATCSNNIGCAYENKGEYDRALAYYQQALEIYLEVQGEMSVETSFAIVNIGCIHEHKMNYQDALDYYIRACKIRQELLGNDHPATIRTRDNITRLQSMIIK